ncbi:MULTISPECIES: sugar phosphate isomerase/epimerase family protein [unclassified Paenibacillus]|uniref:sugar phosphate isomerase/epimerase family protein n=1 Tax=unclassified Paenibacillus TaxID=185978 RepID=UPI0007098E70|nr:MULTISPECIES: sugar phosphate isomerase/epimerase family protein [unclassified Paenibacillus]KQX48201.1 xylose isomerase [Paenibacillus sp. Root444D2]KRE52166.1 xylose isomerase [Paenibacillus sp. Soil724D2]
MGIGTLAHTVGHLPLKQLTEKLSGRGIDFVQLALSKAISDFDTSLGRLSPALANHIGEQFHRAGIRIGVLGCYINPIHPDPQQRRHEINRFKEHLRFARDFGTSIVATETADLTTYLSQDSELYEAMGWTTLKQTVEELAEEAERWGVFIGLEPVFTHTLSSTEKMVRILDEIPSSNLGVVFDPVNLMPPTAVESQEIFLEQAFAAFGDRIVLAHLKDVVIQNNKRQEVRSGKGIFQTKTFLEMLHRVKPGIDISLEQLADDTLDETFQYVRSLMS